MANTLQEPPASPSASSTRGRAKNTRGSLPRVQRSGKSFRGSGSRGRALPRVPKTVHSGKTSPSATVALGEDLTPSTVFFLLFPQCNTQGRNFFFLNLFPECNTRGRNSFFFWKIFPECQLPRHSGKALSFFLIFPSPSARCQGTRGRLCLFF
jgi:hypothetical protein